MSASAAPRPRGRLALALPAAGAGLAVATIVTGLAIQARAGWSLLGPVHSGAGLGTPLPPFLFNWAPAIGGWAAVAAAVVVGAAALAPRLTAPARSGVTVCAGSYGLALALGLSVNLARRGAVGWTSVFALRPHGSPEASREYLPALPQLAQGVAHYVAHFAALLPYLPTHVKGNPPGPLVVMHLLGIDSPARLAAACVAVGALTAPLAYRLGRSLGGERRGREAAMLTAFSPSLMLFGVSSVDYAFAALATATAWLLVSRRRWALAAGCLLAGIGSFQSWLLLAIPAWAALTVWGQGDRRRALTVAAGAAAGVAAVTLGLVAAVGYDPVAVLRALGPIYRTGIAAHRPYAYWVVGSPVAWLVMLGVPVAWAGLRAVARADPAAVALAALVAVSAVAGFTKAETERIWLPFVPLAAVAAAALPLRRPRLVLAVLGAQALVVEVLFNTVW